MPIDLPCVTVHSVAEAYLFLMASRCASCGKGPLRQQSDLTRREASVGGWTLDASCAACSAQSTLHFLIDPMPDRTTAGSDQINPTAGRSQAIDLLGWLSLFQSILTASQSQNDRQTARQLAYEAAQCLDEAMKFYGPDDELPPADAFFSEESRRRFREHPDQFAKSKWRQRRMMLPDKTIKTRASRPRRWWQFWLPSR